MSALAFTYDMLPSRVIFGVGCLDKLPEEIERLGAHRALVLSTPEQRKEGLQMVDRLGARAVGLFDQAVMHVPIEIAEQAREQAKALGADCCVAVGGGSTTGLAKAIALVSTLPILAIPTTYAGSEMTPIWGITESGLKKTGRDPRVLPKTVLYDPTLTVTMPPMLSATSGMNSIAHCVEALYSKDANPIISMMAEEGIRAFAAGLPDGGARSRRIWRLVPTRSMARGSAACRWARWAWRCITSCATRWAAASICRTPRRIRWCCRMPLPILHPAAPEAMSRIARALGREIGCPRTVRSGRFAGRANVTGGSGTQSRPISIRPRISRSRIPTTIRAPSHAKASVHCCRMPSRAAGRPNKVPRRPS